MGRMRDLHIEMSERLSEEYGVPFEIVQDLNWYANSDDEWEELVKAWRDGVDAMIEIVHRKQLKVHKWEVDNDAIEHFLFV